jgi:hypothetical protein
LSDATDLHYDLSGLRVRLRHAPPGWHETMDRWWAPFAAVPARDALLDLTVELHDRPPGPGTPLTAEPLRPSPRAGAVAFSVPEGTICVRQDGRGIIELNRVGAQERCYAAMNLILAALGHALPARDGAVLHAAAILVDGAAFLLVGPAGAGKSTFARTAERAGAGYVSDDVVVVDASAERVELLGVPFRADAARPIGPGRWPLCGLLFPRHGPRPRLAPIGGLLAQVRLTANLLYLDPAGPGAGHVRRVIERLTARVPQRELTFAPDPAFLPLLRELVTP